MVEYVAAMPGFSAVIMITPFLSIVGPGSLGELPNVGMISVPNQFSPPFVVVYEPCPNDEPTVVLAEPNIINGFKG